MLNKITVCHVDIEDDAEVNPDTEQLEWPHDMTQEQYSRYLLNLNASILLNVIDMLQAQMPPLAVLNFINFAIEDENLQDQLAKITKEALAGDLSNFTEIEGQSPEAYNNDNVIDFKKPGGTAH